MFVPFHWHCIVVKVKTDQMFSDRFAQLKQPLLFFGHDRDRQGRVDPCLIDRRSRILPYLFACFSYWFDSRGQSVITVNSFVGKLVVYSFAIRFEVSRNLNCWLLDIAQIAALAKFVATYICVWRYITNKSVNYKHQISTTCRSSNKI